MIIVKFEPKYATPDDIKYFSLDASSAIEARFMIMEQLNKMRKQEFWVYTSYEYEFAGVLLYSNETPTLENFKYTDFNDAFKDNATWQNL